MNIAMNNYKGNYNCDSKLYKVIYFKMPRNLLIKVRIQIVVYIFLICSVHLVSCMDTINKKQQKKEKTSPY